jgi:hypothetical protein
MLFKGPKSFLPPVQRARQQSKGGAHSTSWCRAPWGEVTTLAGLAGQSGSSDGVGSAARFNYLRGIAVDKNGNVYVADSGNHTIRKITPEGIVTTFAGKAGDTGNRDGQGSVARFATPFGMAVDGAGNIYVTDRAGSRADEMHILWAECPAPAVAACAFPRQRSA